MLDSWSTSGIRSFAVSLNSLSISPSRRKADSEFREIANGKPAKTSVTEESRPVARTDALLTKLRELTHNGLNLPPSCLQKDRQ